MSLVAVVLALISAVAWGISDFGGGVVSKRRGPWVTSIAVQVGSLASIAVIAALLPGHPTAADWMWGSLAGLGTGAGTAFLYRGLSSGRMGVVAPVSALGSALVPVVVALSTGERPGPLAAFGIVLALPAIWMIAATTDAPDEAGRPAGTVDGILAGLGFGVGFACIDQIGAAAQLTPLIATQAVSIVPVVVLAVWTRQAFWPATRSAWVGAWLGPLGALANTCLLWAVQSGMLSVVAVLVSLYPAITVALAAAILRERIHRVQGVGLALAVAAVTLISQA